MKRSEYIMMVILVVIVSVYGYFAKTDVTNVIGIIIGGGFLSKGASDFGKNKNYPKAPKL